MQSNHLTFIGGGNMATSIIAGLIGKGVSATDITVLDRKQELLDQLKMAYSVNTQRNIDSLPATNYLFLCVKPQDMRSICRALSKTTLLRSPAREAPIPIIISIAAGVRIDDIRTWLDSELTIIRCMPNTPAMIGVGASGLYSSLDFSAEENKKIKTEVEEFFNAIGISAWLQSEKDLDIVTALSGSGPAYFFSLIEAMQNSAMTLGLDSNTAKTFSLQTALGASQLAQQSELSIVELRDRVTSKGGTTAAAISSLSQSKFDKIIHAALAAATQRAKELAEMLSE